MSVFYFVISSVALLLGERAYRSNILNWTLWYIAFQRLYIDKNIFSF